MGCTSRCVLLRVGCRDDPWACVRIALVVLPSPLILTLSLPLLFPPPQVAVHFADLHDTPGRMQSKGVIRRQVDWAQSRTFFFWRLRRRLTEFDLAAQLAACSGGSTGAGSRHRREAAADLKAWFQQSGGKEEVWEDDRRMMLWLTDNQQVGARTHSRTYLHSPLSPVLSPPCCLITYPPPCTTPSPLLAPPQLFAQYVSTRRVALTAAALAARVGACDAQVLAAAVAGLSPETRALLAAALK